MTEFTHFLANVLLAESEILNFFYSKKNKQAKDYGFIPKIYSYDWISKGYFFNIVLFVSRVLWPVVLISFNVTTLILYFLKKARLPCVVLEGGNTSVLFASSDSAVNVYCKSVVNECTIVFRPGRLCLGENEKHSFVDALQVLSFNQILCVFIRSTHISLLLGYNHKYTELRFLNFYIFEMLLVYKSLKVLNTSTLKKQLFVTDHYDRWALMANKLRDKSYSSLTVIQHGILAIGKSSFDVVIPKKISNVDCLYYFDESSKAIFLEKIFEPSPYIRFVKFRNTLELSLLDTECPSILIVGSPLSFDFHRALTDYIDTHLDRVRIFYKPHPTAIDYGKTRNKHWLWIDDVNYFPKVSVVISYPSSLAIQYQNENIPVFIHEIDEPCSTVCEAYSHIYSYLESVL